MVSEAPAPHLLVIGGSGFLGRHTVAWGQARGFAVDATYWTSGPQPGLLSPARWHRCDIVDAGQIATLVRDISPTAVINTAYRQNGEGAEDICSLGAHHVAVAAAEVGARLVQLSTDLVFDGDLGRPYREDDAVSPISSYGSAKVRAEDLVTETHPNAVIVRTSLIYGHLEAPQEQLVHRAIAEGGISFFTDEWRSPVHVKDLAEAVGVLATISPATGILHVAGPTRLNRLELARELAEHMGLDADALVGGPADPSLGPRASDVTLDVSKAAGLGFELPAPSMALAADRSKS